MTMQTKDLQILQHILQYCIKIENTISRFGNDFATFIADSDYKDSVSMNLLQIGELAGKLSEEYIALTKQTMDWRAMKAMRNFFAHNYDLWIMKEFGKQQYKISRCLRSIAKNKLVHRITVYSLSTIELYFRKSKKPSRLSSFLAVFLGLSFGKILSFISILSL